MCDMNKQINFYGFKSLLVAVICFLAFSSASASNKEENYSLVAENLSAKLRNDLAVEDVKVELKNVREYKISAGKVGFRGEGKAVLIADQLPLRFDVKINIANRSISELAYDFVEPASEFAPSTNEEFLMKELIKQISKDYKTDNIVIAIDGMENVAIAGEAKEFAGIGEVRIGNLVWNKIKFDVVLDTKNKSARKVVYKIER